MTNKAIVVIKRIRDWYLMENDTCIQVYGTMKSPHLLPWFVLDMIVLQQVAYQMTINGFRGMIYGDNKDIWPPLSLYIKAYLFSNTK
jgi:hypothetical protein